VGPAARQADGTLPLDGTEKQEAERLVAIAAAS